MTRIADDAAEGLLRHPEMHDATPERAAALLTIMSASRCTGYLDITTNKRSIYITHNGDTCPLHEGA